MPRILAILALSLACASCGGAGDGRPELSVYAASSLEPPLTAATKALEEAAGARIVFNFGASNDLLRQILAARKADLFLSADGIQMDALDRAGLVEPGTRAAFLGNRLVVVAPTGSELRVASAGDLAAGAGRVAIGDPHGVPVGRYAREWLAGRGVWEKIADRIVPAPNARAVLAAVESGGVRAGIVYRSDAATSTKVTVVYEVPEGEGPAIAYWAAAVRGGSHTGAARRLVDFLKASGVERIFAPYGFGSPPRGADITE